MKFDEGKILLLLSGVLSGIVFTSFIVNTSVSPTTFLTYQQYHRMNQQVNELKSEIKGLYKELDQLDQKLRKYDSSSEKNNSVLETLSKELKEVQLFYGSSPVEGPGIKLIVDDKHKTSYESDEELWNSITHNTDLYYLVNDLKSAGAEAISINGKRIVGSSSITCEGPTIMINGEYVVPPFEILAIGDPKALEFSLTLPESKFKELELRGLPLKVEKVNLIKINGVTKVNNFKYIKQAK
jgi:uncharacterized protein YlxW (UPF0749 family)